MVPSLLKTCIDFGGETEGRKGLQGVEISVAQFGGFSHISSPTLFRSLQTVDEQRKLR